MKTRFGYVSNSSSSSFLVCCNDVDCFGFMRTGEGHDNESHMTFTRDVNDPEHRDDANVREFLAEEYKSVMYQYEYYLEYKDKKWYINMMGGVVVNPLFRFASLNGKLGCNNPEVSALESEGPKLIDDFKAGKIGENAVWEAIAEKAEKFADLLLAEAKKKWRIVSAFGYSDEDGDFWGYMEHEFMGELAHCEQEHFGEYSVVTRNEH